MLEILTFILGPVQTNTYLVVDPLTRETIVIDPAWDGQNIAKQAQSHGWMIKSLWITHGHFDHIGGATGVYEYITPSPGIALHSADLPLWHMQGGAPLFGLSLDPAPEPTLALKDGLTLPLGGHDFIVNHVPGHTLGHVMFTCPSEKVAFVGDVIFAGSIGRTDLPGGDYDMLIESIHTHILSLPDDTRLFCGHGPETTVGEERKHNPFLID
jgi:hydroxyacylglutathione hydrolase